MKPRGDRPGEVLDLTALEATSGSVATLTLAPEDPPSEDRPRKRARLRPEDLIEGGLATIAGGAVAWGVRVVLDQHGILGTALWWYAAALGVFYLLTRDRTGAEAALDRLVTVVVWSVGLLVTALLGWMITFLVIKGLPALRAGFFTEDMSKVGPLTPGGGVKHAIIGTIEQVAIATIFVVPVAVMTAVYLHEVQGRLATPVRFIVDAMSGLPSIVAGLLVFTVWVDGRGFSGFAASMALAVLMLPTVTRASEEIIRTVPESLREGALALGAPQWQVVVRVVLPTALAGLVTAAILGVARAVGETAPVLFTAFGSDRVNWNPFTGPQSDLPLFVFKLIRLPNAAQVDRAWAGALVLVMLVLVLFVTARYFANRSQRKLGRTR
jgi:phosphate transport system permease protein